MAGMHSLLAPANVRRLICCASILVVGCGTGGPKTGSRDAPARFEVLYRENGTRSSDVIQADIEVVWQHMPDVYRQVGLPAAPGDGGRARIFMTPHMEVRGRPLYPGERTSDYIDCGRTTDAAERADRFVVTFAVMTRLTATPEGHTLVETLVDGHAHNAAGSAYSVPCVGRGKLEKQIADGLRRRVTAAR